MSDIFISYSHADEKRIPALVGALKGQGWSVWWDPHIPLREHSFQAIEAAIRSAKCALVLWSEASVKSDNVRNEAHLAKKCGILVPVQIDEGIDIPFEFQLLQTAQLGDWDWNNRSHPEFEKLLETIASLLKQPLRYSPQVDTRKLRQATVKLALGLGVSAAILHAVSMIAAKRLAPSLVQPEKYDFILTLLHILIVGSILLLVFTPIGTPRQSERPWNKLAKKTLNQFMKGWCAIWTTWLLVYLYLCVVWKLADAGFAIPNACFGLTIDFLNINLENISAFKVLQGTQVDKLDGTVDHHIFNFKQWRTLEKINRIDIARKKNKADEQKNNHTDKRDPGYFNGGFFCQDSLFLARR